MIDHVSRPSLRQWARRVARQSRNAVLRDILIRRYLKNNNNPRKLNLGCGSNVLAGWLNTDLVPTNRHVAAIDVTQPFPLDDASFDYVLTEHQIEHVGRQEGLYMLRESYRVLRPGGRIRVLTPDLAVFIDLYGPDRSEDQQHYIDWICDNFLQTEHVKSAALVINNVFRNWGHQFIYDEATLRDSLARSGFVDIQRAEPGESTYPELRDVDAQGLDRRINRIETMILEASKP